MVTFPIFVTCCKLPNDPVGQLVPFAKHGNCPFTKSDVKLADVPLITLANKLVAVELVVISFVVKKFVVVTLPATKRVMVLLADVKFAKVAFKAVRLVPEAEAKPNHCVDVTLVKLPLVAAKVAIFKLLPVALVKISWVAVAAENTAVPLNKFTLAAVRFSAVKLVPEAEAKPSH